MYAGSRRRDDGSVLVLTLVLVMVMAVIVMALARYVTVGLKTSDVASERTETNADASNVMNWAIEEFAKKQLQPDDDCGAAPDYLPITVPGGLASNGSTTTLECAQTNPITGEPVVHLVAASNGMQTRVVEATIEVPRYSHGARVSDWRVDIAIDVPDYVTTTTTAPSATTSTTAAPAGNTAPTANPTVWVVNEGTSAQHLDATDGDGTIVSAVIDSLPAGWSATNPAGTQIELTASGVGDYSLSYTVTDDDGATATNTLDVEVTTSTTTTTTSTTTTTTTTVPPMPACSFIVTNAHQNGKSGSGSLTVSNGGSDFTGWQIRLTQKSTSYPWQFTWGDPGLTVTSGTPYVTVAGSQTVTQTSPFTVTANVAQTDNGAPAAAKISVNDSLTCDVLSP